MSPQSTVNTLVGHRQVYLFSVSRTVKPNIFAILHALC